MADITSPLERRVLTDRRLIGGSESLRVLARSLLIVRPLLALRELLGAVAVRVRVGKREAGVRPRIGRASGGMTTKFASTFTGV